MKDGYFYVDFDSYSRERWGHSYTGYNCLGATGKLIIVNIPDELWTVTENYPEGKICIDCGENNTRSLTKDRGCIESYVLRDFFPDWEWDEN